MNVWVDSARICSSSKNAVAGVSSPTAGFIISRTNASLAEPIIDRSYLFGYKQVTDFQLVNLAAKHKAILATFDSRLSASLAESDRHHVFIIPV